MLVHQFFRNIMGIRSKKSCASLLFMAVLTTVLTVSAGLGGQQALAATLHLQLPEKVARGEAFEALALSDVPVSSVTFDWNGKRHVIPTEPQGSGSMAKVLLPVPGDKDKIVDMDLVARAGKGLTAKAVVKLYSKKRPVQKLTVDSKFVNPPAHEMKRIADDRRKVREVLAHFEPQRYWTLPMLRPVPGTISSQYGLRRFFNGEMRSMHKGLDLRGAQGTPILAAAGGRVALNDDLYYSGNAVYLDHGQGVFTAYLHLSESKVRVGQMVERGDVIGLVGATGRVTGPHLHLTLLVQGVAVDPDPLLEAALPAAPAATKKASSAHDKQKR